MTTNTANETANVTQDAVIAALRAGRYRCTADVFETISPDDPTDGLDTTVYANVTMRADGLPVLLVQSQVSFPSAAFEGSDGVEVAVDLNETASDDQVLRIDVEGAFPDLEVDRHRIEATIRSSATFRKAMTAVGRKALDDIADRRQGNLRAKAPDVVRGLIGDLGDLLAPGASQTKKIEAVADTICTPASTVKKWSLGVRVPEGIELVWRVLMEAAIDAQPRKHVDGLTGHFEYAGRVYDLDYDGRSDGRHRFAVIGWEFFHNEPRSTYLGTLHVEPFATLEEVIRQSRAWAGEEAAQV